MRMTAPRSALWALALAMGASSACADGSVFDSLAKTTGLATDVPPPPDFVVKSRAAAPSAPIPVMGSPEEPPSRVKSEADLKAMDAELESANRKHDALRSAFPPSAKARAEERPTEKMTKKPAPTP